MQYVEQQTVNKTPIVTRGVSLATAEDLGKWMGASEHTIFNFSPRFIGNIHNPWLLCFYLLYLHSSALDMAIHIQSFTISHFPSLMITMSKPAYLAIKEHSPTKPAVILCPRGDNAS